MANITISATSAGFGSGSSAQISKEGIEIGFGAYSIGVNVAVFDETTGAVLATNSFNTSQKPNDDIFANYINGLPAGRIVAIAVQGNAIPTDGLSDAAKEAFKSIGSNQVDAVQPNYAWSLIGIKGQPGSGSESTTWPVASASKTVEIASIGPDPGVPKKLQFKQIVWLRYATPEFGNSGVAIQNGIALVGASKTDIPGFADAGSVYAVNLDYDQWQPQQQLIPEDLAASDNFGQSVAMNGNNAIVGANLKEGFNKLSNTGAAYMYQLEAGKWVEKQQLQPLDLAATDYFGYSVAIDGNLAIVGAYGAASWRGKNDGGAAYIFELQSGEWKQIQLLQPSDLVASDYFGYSVAISGNLAIVGAYMAEAPGKTNAGAAYIFALEDGKWVQKQKLQPGELAANDYFGYSVAIENDTAMVGAYLREDDGNANAGAVYVFELESDQWTQKQKLKPREQLLANEYFGWSVSISGELAVVGAPQSKSAALANAGAIYLFQKDNNGVWQSKQKYQPADLLAQDKFGNSLDLQGNKVIVGTKKAFVAIYDVVAEG